MISESKQELLFYLLTILIILLINESIALVR